MAVVKGPGEMGKFRVLGVVAAVAWVVFGITLVIRLMAGDGGLLAAEMLREAPPEYTGLPEGEYPGVGKMTADYLAGRTDTFRYVIADGAGGQAECFRPNEAAHMADCRGLIRLDETVCAVCLAAAAALTAAGLIPSAGRKGFLRGILYGLRTAGVLAAGMLIWALADFDGLFITFHRAAFTNEGWLMDPRENLLIRLMPEGFFVRLGIRGLLRALVMPAALEAAARIGLRRVRG